MIPCAAPRLLGTVKDGQWKYCYSCRLCSFRPDPGRPFDSAYPGHDRPRFVVRLPGKPTSSDPEVWYAVNAYSAKRLRAGWHRHVISAIAFYFVPEIDVAVYASTCGVIAVAGIIVVLIQSIGFLRSLKPKD